jgi:hypothetical protein
MKIAKPPSGLTVLLGFVAVLLFLAWLYPAHHAMMPDNAALTLVCFSFGWTFLAMWQVSRGCRKLGWKRSNYTQFLSGPRPADPDELAIWRWTFQLCCAILALVLCVLTIAFVT